VLTHLTPFVRPLCHTLCHTLCCTILPHPFVALFGLPFTAPAPFVTPFHPLAGEKTDASVLVKMLRGEKFGPAQALEELEAFATSWKTGKLSDFMAEHGQGEMSPEIGKMPASVIEQILDTTDFMEVGGVLRVCVCVGGGGGG
jgi:hypothetical protein